MVGVENPKEGAASDGSGWGDFVSPVVAVLVVAVVVGVVVVAVVVDVGGVAVVVVIFVVVILHTWPNPSANSNIYFLSHLVIVLVVSTVATSASVVADRVVSTG